jgi:uncharacterized protein YndB with AHSA1/START domain
MTMHLDSPPTDGRLDESDGKTVLRFERRFAHPVERVWRALTEPEQMARWFCGVSEIELDLVSGGAFGLKIVGPPELLEMVGGESEMQVPVREVVPLRVFEHGFLDDPAYSVRYELEPDGDGCRLHVAATVPSRRMAIEQDFFVGLHMSLDGLGQVVDGLPSPWTRSRFDELRSRYADA